MDTYRAAIIGCGGRAREHARSYHQAAGTQLAAVADVDWTRAEAFGREFNARPYRTAAEMLEREKPDIVSIATRPEGRCDLTVACAAAGVRGIIAEKPMALTLDEAHRMVDECERAGAVLTVSHQMRYCPEFEAGKAAVDEGEIGRLYYLRGACYGSLMQQGTHVIDMLRWFAGDARVSWVMAQAADYDWARWDPGHPSPLFTMGYLVFENDLRASLESGPRYAPAIGTQPGWLNKRVEALGTEGMADTVVANYCRVFAKNSFREVAVGPEEWDRATVRFIQDLCRVLEQGGEHRNHARTSLHSFEVIQALAASALAGGRVELPLPPGAEPLQALLQFHGG